MRYKSNSPSNTKKFAANIANKFLKNSNVFTLNGDLGAGKTVFVQGFAKSLGINEKIISPTFVVMRQHKIPNSKKTLYHIDLYRLENEKGIGLEDLFVDPNAVMLIEWSEKIAGRLPENRVDILLKQLSENERDIIVTLNNS